MIRVDVDGWGSESKRGAVERNIDDNKGNVCVEENTAGVRDGDHGVAEHVSNHSNQWSSLFSSCDTPLMFMIPCPSLIAKIPVKDNNDGCSQF